MRLLSGYNDCHQNNRRIRNLHPFAKLVGTGLILLYFLSLIPWRKGGSRLRPMLAWQSGPLPPKKEFRYSLCGDITDGIEDNLLSRLNKRIYCKTRSRPKDPVLNPNDLPRNATYFLTHDLHNTDNLGDFLFAVASTLGLAESTGRKAVFPASPQIHLFQTTFFSEEHFSKNDSDRLALHKPVKQEINEEPAGKYDATLQGRLDTKNRSSSYSLPVLCSLTGPLQSWKYFHSNRELIHRQFAFNDATYQHAAEVIRNAVVSYPNTTTLIGIYIDQRISKSDLVSATFDSYILSTMRELSETYTNTAFIVISSDLNHYRKLLSGTSENVLFTGTKSADLDIAVLSLMDHIILTDGVVGWWGAYLSDAETVFYYLNSTETDPNLDGKNDLNDYFLPDWIPKN